jgi:hypothetical protein
MISGFRHEVYEIPVLLGYYTAYGGVSEQPIGSVIGGQTYWPHWLYRNVGEELPPYTLQYPNKAQISFEKSLRFASLLWHSVNLPPYTL